MEDSIRYSGRRGGGCGGRVSGGRGQCNGGSGGGDTNGRRGTL